MKKWLVLIMLLVLVLIPGVAMADYTTDLCTDYSKITASSFTTSYTPSKAIDNDISNASAWYTDQALPAWIKYEFDTPKKIVKYTMLGTWQESPKNWKLQGSNDNVNWTDVHTVSNANVYTKKEYTFINNNSYTYYRFYITGTVGASIHEIEMMEEISPISVPTNLTAVPGNAQVVLNWDSVTNATGYNIKSATTAGGPYTTIESVTSSVYNYTDTGLTNGTTYYYVVTATNSGGESANSNEVFATPQQSLPNAPSGLTATAGNAQVSLSWGSVTDATSYEVKRGTAAGGPYTTIASSTSPSYVDTGLTNGTTYYFVVTAINTGGESANSNEASATPQVPSSDGRAILWVTMNNGSDIDYDLSMNEVNAFINWYKSKSSGGVGDPFYTFSKTPISPYTSRTDYLIFDKIVCFKVNTY